MRKIIVFEHLSLDGVIQAPSGKDEDLSNQFEQGGWTASFQHPEIGQIIRGWMHEDCSLLLGRTTYEQWSSYWPLHADIWPAADRAMKYVATPHERPVLWQPTTYLKHPISELERLKQQDGPPFHVWGSSQLVHALFQADLIDELRLITYPVIIGSGKRLFPDQGMIPLTWDVMEERTFPNGVSVVRYERK
ncbi:dihydrofolate reductase family protein [Exiguobacterium sp. TDN 0502]|uniref:dihydrofolate reductase family protein n=1 Tax=Exiguobacterium sp. TDN 0502 TaxID=3420731 RepID=UPI003D77B0AC